MAAQAIPVLRVELLGPVRAWRAEEELILGSARRKAVFAMLAARAGRAVSREEIVTGVWGEAPPASVDGSLYTYVSGLRRVLDPVRTRWSTGEVLVSAGSGYSLRIAQEDLDVHRFTSLRDRAAEQAARGETESAVRSLSDAIALWRGEPLSGISGPFAESTRAQLAELRLSAVERRASLRLELGANQEVGAELADLVSEHPLREGLSALLMRALHGCGRTADALAVYRGIQAKLADELGIDPGGTLRDLNDRILRDDPALAVGPRMSSGVASGRRLERLPLPHTAPRPPEVLVGRDREVAALRARVADAAAGHGAVVWIEGEPGIGKSALLAAGLAGAHECGVRVLWGFGDELGGRFPMRTILDSLGLGFTAEALPTASPWHGDDLVGAAVDRVLLLIDELCAEGPVALVLDDLEWADRESLLVWHRLARSARRRPLLLVGACRPGPRRAELGQVRAVALDAGGDLLELRPLDADAVADLYAAVLGTEPGPSLLGFAARSAGNPLYLRETIAALRRDGLVEVDDGLAEITESVLEGPPPPALAAAITRRVAFLVEDSREPLRWAALLGAEFTLDDLGVLLGRTPSQLMPLVEEATSAGVLQESGHRFAFRHPVVRDSIYDSMPLAVRVALHRQAAEALDRAGAHIERIAEQLLATPASDGWTMTWLLDNTAELAGRAPENTADLLRRALDGAMPESAREILTARLARLLFWLGRRPESEARAVLATTADANLAAEMRLILAYLDYSRGDAEKAVSALRTAAADPEVPERWRARHLSLQAMIERCGLDDLDAAERTANEALVRARAADDDFAVAHSLQNLWQVESVARRHELALHHVDEALSSLHGRTSYADLQLSLLDNRVFTLQNLDRLDEASHTLASAQDLVLRRGLPGGLHIPAAVHYFWLGRWDEAITELDSVMQDGPEITFYGLRQRGAILLLHGAAALIAAHRDDTSELEHHLKAAEDYPLATVADKEHCDFLVAAAALAAEQRGRSDEALDLFLPILDLKYAKMMLRHQWLPTVVRVALGIGATDVADRALGVCQAEAELELVPGRASAAHDWCRGLIGREPNTLLTVADRFAVVGRPLEHALVLEDVAVLLAERGDSERAAEAISDATLIYTDIGAAWDIRRAEARLQPYCLRRLADGGPSSDERHRRVLSVADLRVAELVVAGWPNTDIAVRLAMSRTAVQTHVARVQRKLGVHSRLGVTRRALRVHLDRWHGEPGQRTDETALAPKPLARGGH